MFKPLPALGVVVATEENAIPFVVAGAAVVEALVVVVVTGEKITPVVVVVAGAAKVEATVAVVVFTPLPALGVVVGIDENAIPFVVGALVVVVVGIVVGGIVVVGTVLVIGVVGPVVVLTLLPTVC